jgi:Na+/melibiose symporter-like transporter
MIKEIIFTIFLAIVSTTLTLIQDKITQRTGQTNPFLFLGAPLALVMFAFLIYCLWFQGLINTLYLVVIYFVVAGVVELIKYIFFK